MSLWLVAGHEVVNLSSPVLYLLDGEIQFSPPCSDPSALLWWMLRTKKKTEKVFLYVRSTHAGSSCEYFQFAFVSHLLLTRIFLRKLPQASRRRRTGIQSARVQSTRTVVLGPSVPTKAYGSQDTAAK
jgi:hypothetical protein